MRTIFNNVAEGVYTNYSFGKVKIIDRERGVKTHCNFRAEQNKVVRIILGPGIAQTGNNATLQKRGFESHYANLLVWLPAVFLRKLYLSWYESERVVPSSTWRRGSKALIHNRIIAEPKGQTKIYGCQAMLGEDFHGFGFQWQWAVCTR